MYTHPYTSHLLHFAPPSMGAPLPSSTSTTTTTPKLSMKRSVSEDSSDDDMDISRQSLPMSDGQVDGSYNLMSRKKRRGMIEKRRRDRINNSLHELKRLVPTAFEKQGSAKLEKAEILQLTVDHLRTLHSKGFDAFSFEPQKFATDYHILGFRECAAEMARYLVVHEGLDLQDPMRLRLISHLQCYATQRELSLKSNTGWNPSLFTTPIYQASSGSHTPSQQSQQASSDPSSTPNSAGQSNPSQSTSSPCDSMNINSLTHHHPSSYSTNSYYAQQPVGESSMITSSTGSAPPSMACNGSKTASLPASFPMTAYPSVSSTAHAQVCTVSPSPASYSYSYPAGTYFPPAPSYMAPMMPAPSSNNLASNGQSSVKHYRPWGTELTTY